MQVKDLEDNAPLEYIKIEIPQSIPMKELLDIGLNTRHVYARGGWHGGAGGLWVSNTPGSEGRIFPLTGHIVEEIFEWEVV